MKQSDKDKALNDYLDNIPFVIIADQFGNPISSNWIDSEGKKHE